MKIDLKIDFKKGAIFQNTKKILRRKPKNKKIEPS